MTRTSSAETGVVVPTLGERPDYLIENLKSLRAAGDCMVAVVRPVAVADIDDALSEYVDLFVDDPGAGLAAAINAGIRSFPARVRLATWLGDDDRLTPSSLEVARASLDRDESVFVYGQCRYIDELGRPLWLNKSGRWAVRLMTYGPQLVPQPGSLFSREVFDSIGGLDESLRWAFDLDLFLRLRKCGRITFVPEALAEFRWHEGSLSVGGRSGSVEEASRVRRRYVGPIGRFVSPISEPVARVAIAKAGGILSARAKRGGGSLGR